MLKSLFFNVVKKSRFYVFRLSSGFFFNQEKFLLLNLVVCYILYVAIFDLLI